MVTCPTRQRQRRANDRRVDAQVAGHAFPRFVPLPVEKYRGLPAEKYRTMPVELCAVGGALAGAEVGPPVVIIGGAVAAGLGWEAGNRVRSKICDQLVQANDAHAICMKDAKSRGGPCSGGNPLDQEQCAERFGKGRGM